MPGTNPSSNRGGDLTRSGAVAAHRTHNPGVGGAIPLSATTITAPTGGFSLGRGHLHTFKGLSVLTRDHLQTYLNQFEALRGISVEYESDLKRSIAPQVVMLTGMVNIQGTPHLFEAEINLNEFHTREDLMKLAGAMLKAFDRAGVETLEN